MRFWLLIISIEHPYFGAVFGVDGRGGGTGPELVQLQIASKILSTTPRALDTTNLPRLSPENTELLLPVTEKAKIFLVTQSTTKASSLPGQNHSTFIVQITTQRHYILGHKVKLNKAQAQRTCNLILDNKNSS